MPDVQDELVPLAPQPCSAHVYGDVDVIAVPGVDIHGMEASAGAVDDLEPLPLLHCQVHQQRAVREVSKGLWRREGSGRRVGSRTLEYTGG